MTDLAALEAAIIDAPTDRTVRLVYADALDESGAPGAAPRAEFVRAQIEIEALPETDFRRATLVGRCDELFAEHWDDWWRPVCAAVGLPIPYQPRRRRKPGGARRGSRHRRGAPYERAADYPGAYSVRSNEHGFTAQFIAGFPELLYLQTAPRDLDRWAAAVPLARLRWTGGPFDAAQWAALDGPHLGRVADLTIDRLPPEGATALARSEHLGALAALKVLPLRPAAGVLRELLTAPTYTDLKALTLTGVTPPDAIVALAERCALPLEALSFGLSEIPAAPAGLGLGGAIGAMVSEMLSRLFTDSPLPPGPVRWPDYWPALAVLARAPVMRHLRTLQITDTGPQANFIGGLIARLELTDAPSVLDPDALFPDALVRALADALTADRLVKLELPAARLTPAARAALAHRFGPRFVPA